MTTLKRTGVGIELQQKIAESAQKTIEHESDLFTKEIQTEIINADSATVDLKPTLQKLGIEHFQFIIYHPPYWDIIQFSELEEDLSNASTLE